MLNDLRVVRAQAAASVAMTAWFSYALITESDVKFPMTDDLFIDVLLGGTKDSPFARRCIACMYYLFNLARLLFVLTPLKESSCNAAIGTYWLETLFYFSHIFSWGHAEWNWFHIFVMFTNFWMATDITSSEREKMRPPVYPEQRWSICQWCMFANFFAYVILWAWISFEADELLDLTFAKDFYPSPTEASLADQRVLSWIYMACGWLIFVSINFWQEFPGLASGFVSYLCMGLFWGMEAFVFGSEPNFAVIGFCAFMGLFLIVTEMMCPPRFNKEDQIYMTKFWLEDDKKYFWPKWNREFEHMAEPLDMIVKPENDKQGDGFVKVDSKSKFITGVSAERKLNK